MLSRREVPVNRKRIVLAAEVAAGFAVASLAATPTARAADEDFGEHGVMIAADRLLPILDYDSAKTDNSAGGSTTDSRVSFAFGSNGATSLETFYNLPRLGFDVVVIPHLTLGGSAWIYTDLSANTTDTPQTGPSTTTDQAKITYWGFSPRVGYVIPLASHVLYLWPRAGISYNNLGTSSVTVDNVTTPGGTLWQVAATVEAMFVITPWTRHFGFTVGPTVDIPLAGKESSTSTTNGVTTTTSVNETMWQVGLQAGLVGHF